MGGGPSEVEPWVPSEALQNKEPIAEGPLQYRPGMRALNKSVYIHIYICICIYVYVYTYIYICVYVHSHFCDCCLSHMESSCCTILELVLSNHMPIWYGLLGVN